MKEKIIAGLKTKYSNLGFGQKAFDGVADYLSKTVTDEKQIEPAIGGVESLLKAFQSDIDKVRTEKTTLQSKLDELSKAAPANGGLQANPEPTPQHDDFDAKMQAWFEKNVKPIQDELSSYKAKEAASARQNLITAKAKELGIPEWRMKEGFSIADEADEKTISQCLASVKQNIVTAGLEGKNSGFPLSTPEAQGKELAKAWAQNLPDAEN